MFHWGNKQEKTHSWFSVFDEQGRHLPLVELMQEHWSGDQPANQAPQVLALRVDGLASPHQSFMATSNIHQADLLARDPDGDSLTNYWEIKPRSQSGTDYVGTGRPAMQGLLPQTDSSSIRFSLPKKPGPYRLFAHVYDNHNHVATANFSFEVRLSDKRLKND